MKILVTGGAGYIGSQIVLDLLNQNHEPIVVDNFSYSTEQNLDAIKKITGKDFQIIRADLKNAEELKNLPKVDCVIHLAALKAVGKSVEKPIECYRNNILGTLNLVTWMRDNNVQNIIFSSTAVVYGPPKTPIVTETTDTDPRSPYASSKLSSEQILTDSAKAYGMNVVVLRYFNVAGCYKTGEIGDIQVNVQNLIPSMMLTHLGIRKDKLKVFGNDYETKDGTGVRDYIHVGDLSRAHILAIDYLKENPGQIFNLGSGKGYSVMEVIQTFEKVTGEKLDYEIAPRRPGDVGIFLADSSKAKSEMGWEAKLTLEDMIDSMWKWYKTGFKN